MTIGLITTVASMAGISSASARRVAASASHRYKVYQIKKKSGGTRTVAQPAREVKALQRSLIICLKPFLPVHSAATAYNVGDSIKQNAEMHREARYLLKMDFSNFFPSIRAPDLVSHIQKYCPDTFSDSEIKFMVDLVLWKGEPRADRALCIGAPSSPFLSNSIMFDFDGSVSKVCRSLGVIFTRYSDDLTFSSTKENVLNEVEAAVRSIVDNSRYPRLSLNEEKRISIARNTAMRVTGLTLANQGFVSVGRIRKRGVRAGINCFIKGKLNAEKTQKLKGEIAFVISIEPEYWQVLYATYGDACLEVLPRRKSA